MKKWTVLLTRLATVSAVVHVTAPTQEAAEDLALERQYDVSLTWEFDEETAPDGADITDVQEEDC